MNPFTLAFRFFHYGRYLRDSESDRLSPLFLGYETWVRGYSYYSYNLRNCSSSDNYADCPDFSRLIGSRVGVFNAELRLPLLGNEQFGLINFPYLPMELVAFLDGGVAWSRGEIPVPKLIHNTRRCAGFQCRRHTNQSFCLLVLQIYYAYLSTHRQRRKLGISFRSDGKSSFPLMPSGITPYKCICKGGHIKSRLSVLSIWRIFCTRLRPKHIFRCS